VGPKLLSCFTVVTPLMLIYLTHVILIFDLILKLIGDQKLLSCYSCDTFQSVLMFETHAMLIFNVQTLYPIIKVHSWVQTL
jgi:hypothetical protein